MKTALIALLALAGILAAPLALNVADKAIAEKRTTETVNQAVKEEAIPPSSEALEEGKPVKSVPVKKIITLEASTTIVLRGPVTGGSVAKAIKELKEASRKVSKDTALYLVLDTSGGSIMDGMDLIDFAKALPQKVHTVTLFAASMGFQIAQNLDTRYIIRSGTLMSHRASVSGLGGQVKGELETRYKMIRRAVDYLDHVASKRMEMETSKYENMIINEYWVYGFDAVSEKAADEQVLVKCGESLDGSDVLQIQTFFGPVTVTFAKCPLIKEPESINFGNMTAEDRSKAEDAVKLSFSDKAKFVNQYITTSRFFEIFR